MPWEPISIISKDAIDVEGDQVAVVWTLSRHPDSDWAREFRSSSLDRRAFEEFPRMPSPDVRTGGTIHWTVPAGELRVAVEYVKACVDGANISCRQLLARREEDRRRRAAEEEAKADRLRQAQQALNALD